MSFLNLGDLLDWGKDDVGHEIGIIKAGTGWGKTNLAVTKLSCGYKFPLLLEPTTTIKEQTVKDYDQAEYLWKGDLIKPNPRNNNVRVACFSSLGQFLTDGNEIKNAPDLLIIDEIDQVAKWSMRFIGYLEAWDWILNNLGKMRVCGLSATPELLLDYMPDLNFRNIARDKEPKYQADQIEVIQHSTVSTYLKSLDYNSDRKAIVYVQSAKQCASLAEKYPKSGFLISRHNEDKLTDDGLPLNEIMLSQQVPVKPFGETDLREYILKTHELPDEIDILFFNDSLLTGVNIDDRRVKHVICETVDQAAIIQSIGRVRHDLEQITVITNNRNKKPFFEDLDRARDFFNNENDLETWYKQEQWLIRKYIKEQRKIDFDILTFKSGETIKVNPFAKACYEYLLHTYDQLERKQTARNFFDNVLLPYSKSGRIDYITPDEVRKAATNNKRFDDEIIKRYSNRKLFKQDKEQLAAELNLIDAQRRAKGWTTVKKYLINRGYEIRDCGSKSVNPHTGLRQTYSEIFWPKKLMQDPY